MKKNRKYFLLILIAIAALVGIINTYQNRKIVPSLPCGIPPNQLNSHSDVRAAGLNDPQFVFDSEYEWEKDTLKVFFYDITDPKIKKKTLKYANIWSKHSGIPFVEVPNNIDSDIRVGFRHGGGYSSYIGNDAENHFGEITLFLENLDQQPDSEFKRVVLHEFGHALGSHHEHQGKNANIEWNKKNVYAYYLSKGWDSSEVEANIFTKIDADINSPFDKKSIMIYAIPKSFTLDGTSIGWNSKLSKTDKQYLKKIYN